MNISERIRKTLNFESVDRLPVMEWAPWWKLTLDRWHAEGLLEFSDLNESYRYFGLDLHNQIWIRGVSNPPSVDREELVRDEADYEEVRPYLFGEDTLDFAKLRQVTDLQNEGKAAFWLSLDGFFWVPRTLFGIEPHFYAFYDYPELMHRINEDNLRYNLWVIDQVCQSGIPVFATIAEDMSYNHGPMCSKALFDEFIAPYYKQLIPKLLDKGITPFVDSDGDVRELIGWFMELGVQGFLPLERMAGVDIVSLREEYPTLRMIGGFDKTTMHLGEERMRQEFERILPVMKQGGYIASVDHQTPPEVSLENYKVYVRLLNEYCRLACN